MLRADGSGLVRRGLFTYRKYPDGSLVFEGADFCAGRMTCGEVLYDVTDHLGSVRSVVRSGSSTPMTYDEYGVYGARTRMPLATPTSPEPSLRRGFTGKEDQQTEFGVPYTDFGARHYSPALRRWMVPDPLSEKYYGLSPYAYCNADPVNKLDPDGKKVVFSDKCSDGFKKRFAETVKYMNKTGTSWHLAKLQESETVFTIAESEVGNHYSPNDHTIMWNARRAYQFNDGIRTSPTLSLIHEVVHAYRDDNGDNKEDVNGVVINKTDIADERYKTKEEREVIEGYEQIAARLLGEIGEEQVTRTNHNGSALPFDASKYKPEELSRAMREHNDIVQ